MKGIIILEGADGTGKTTLARELVDRYGARYLHNGLWRNMWQRHLGCVDLAIRWSQTGLVVIDRLWLSEQIYGQVFRAGPASDLGARCLDRLLQRHGALTVLCVRANLEGHVRHFNLLKAVRPEKFDRVREVAVRYYDLAHGNLARAGEEYANQLTRFQDYGRRGDVAIYDMDRDGRDLRRFGEQLVVQLVGLRRARLRDQHDAARPNLTGSAETARYLFVGEALSPRACPRAAPFLWGDGAGAASHLNAALRALRFDETRGLWTNALGPDDWLPTLREELSATVKVIALGRAAEARVRALRFPHFAYLHHPQWYRRFHATDGRLERELGQVLRG